MSLTVSKVGPYFSSGSISFSQLRSTFKQTSSGSISFSEYRRDTNTGSTNPIVPDATENSSIATSSNLKISQFRNSIKYYNLNQGSGDIEENLNIANSSLWNGNLGKNIAKTITLAGRNGSTNGSPAVSLNASAIYNVLLVITGNILGTGGSPGAKGDKNQSNGSVISNAGNGGNGGTALYINTNGTGTVTVRTSDTAKVYGGGGGGGGGGWGGNGADGSYTTYFSYYISIGGGSVSNGSSTYYVRCQQACANAGGEWANNCYKHISQGGQNCGGNPSYWGDAVCYSDDFTRVANTTSCRKTVTGSNTNPSYGGHGGDGTAGGAGRGRFQDRTFAENAPILGQPDGKTARSHSSAGNAGRGGKGGNGGDWGEPGDNSGAENGYPGYYSNGTTVYQTGGSRGSAGAAGAAVAGSGYVLTGSSSVYKGPR
jgi:hypothetical protein